MTALLDTGFLLAVLDADDDFHTACTTVMLTESQPLLPDVILPELAFMVLRELGYPVLSHFLQSIVQGELAIERTTNEDLSRTVEILEKYADSRIDFVDCGVPPEKWRVR